LSWTWYPLRYRSLLTIFLWFLLTFSMLWGFLGSCCLREAAYLYYHLT